MIHALFSTDGLPLGFYHEGINVIPDGTTPITEDQWLEFLGNQGRRRWDGSNVVDYLPPVVEVFEPITRRQLRLTLVRNGISLAAVDAAIASMPDGIEKQEAQIEWADASTFNRDHPTLLLIASGLGLTEAQIDAMWAEAVTA